MTWNGSTPVYNKRYYFKDHLGSIRVTTDSTGMTLSARDFYPFGETVREYDSASITNRYQFTEKERDTETNFDYFGARYYDSEIGRWVSVDPMADKYPGWSPYNYTMNNPLRFIDPKGMDWYAVEGAVGGYKWDPDIKSQEDLDKRGIKGKYMGARFAHKDKLFGRRTYRADGTILFEDESLAYVFMLQRQEKNKRESAGYIMEHGVLVLPDNSSTGTHAKIGSPEDGAHWWTDQKKVAGIVHTHAGEDNPSVEDEETVNTWRVPNLVLLNWGVIPMGPTIGRAYQPLRTEVNLLTLKKLKQAGFIK